MKSFPLPNLFCSSTILIFVSLGLTGCTEKNSYSDMTSANGVYMELEEGDLEHLQAAEPFYLAIAKRDYGKAYDLLSSWAKKDLVEGQFVFSDETKESKSKPIPELTKQMFVDYMQKFEKQEAIPSKVDEMYVYTTEKEDLEYSRSMVSGRLIVTIPESVPKEVRRSVIEGYIVCEHSPQSLKTAMEEYEIDEKTATTDEGYLPLATVSTYMVEEDGQLKVGYFEIYLDY